MVAAAALALLAPAGASAAAPCWKQLINDWYDGRIDKAYPAHCYREAIANLPADVSAYSSAREDIERALLGAIQQNGGEPPGANQLIQPPKVARRSVPTPISAPSTGGTEEGAPAGDEPTAAAGDPTRDDHDGVVGWLRPSNADSIPIPLLILAGLAFVLLAVAGASVLARKIQARRGLEPPA